MEIDTESVESDLARDLLLFDAENRALPGYYWDFPTIVDGKPMVCRGVYLLRSGAETPRVQIQEVLSQQLEARGLSLGHYRKKRYAERGFEPHKPYSCQRVLLVGEAAGIDPVTGEGIAQAIQYGAVAGRYLSRCFREVDFEFADWPARVRRSMVGRDLFVRVLGVPLFYGGPRPNVERFLLSTPEFIRLGLQHFAGKPWSRTAMLRASWAMLRHTARWARSPSAPVGTAAGVPEGVVERSRA